MGRIEIEIYAENKYNKQTIKRPRTGAATHARNVQFHTHIACHVAVSGINHPAKNYIK